MMNGGVNEMDAPKTLQEAILYFADEDKSREFVARLRWPNGVACPRCGSQDTPFLESRKVWQCKGQHPRIRWMMHPR